MFRLPDPKKQAEFDKKAQEARKNSTYKICKGCHRIYNFCICGEDENHDTYEYQSDYEKQDDHVYLEIEGEFANFHGRR